METFKIICKGSEIDERIIEMKINIALKKCVIKIGNLNIGTSTFTTIDDKHFWVVTGRRAFTNWKSFRYYQRWTKYEKLFYKDAR